MLPSASKHGRNQRSTGSRLTSKPRRPFLFAAVAAGEPGVQRALTLLKDEVDRDMALLGVRSIAEVTPDLVRRLGPEPSFGRNTL